jgi:hypothetical protein
MEYTKKTNVVVCESLATGHAWSACRHLVLACVFFAMCLMVSTDASAQSDNCETATSIAGIGSWNFSTTQSTTSYHGAGGSEGEIDRSVSKDVFFSWTAPYAGSYRISTEGSNFDTQIRLYGGSDCSGNFVDENDDAFGLQSLIVRHEVGVWSEWTIQVGGVFGTYGDVQLSIERTGDHCALSDDQFQGNTGCRTATQLTDGMVFDLVSSRYSSSDFFKVRVPDNDDLSVGLYFEGNSADIDLFLWDFSDDYCGTGISVGSDDFGSSQMRVGDEEAVLWSNDTGRVVTVVIEVRFDPSSNAECVEYDMSISGALSLAEITTFCDPAEDNTTGWPAVLSGWWMGKGVQSDLHLDTVHGVPNNIGYYLIGSAVADPGLVISEGRLCLAVSGVDNFGRYNEIGGVLNSIGVFDSEGVLINVSSSSSSGFGFDVPLAIPGIGGTIMTGDTWHFQLWYRAGLTGSSNFSNGLSVTF